MQGVTDRRGERVTPGCCKVGPGSGVKHNSDRACGRWDGVTCSSCLLHSNLSTGLHSQLSVWYINHQFYQFCSNSPGLGDIHPPGNPGPPYMFHLIVSGTISAFGFSTCPEVTLNPVPTTTSISRPGTAASTLTLVTHPPAKASSTEFCALSPTAKGFPTIDACVNVPDVTFEVTTSFTGRASTLAVPTFTFGSETTVLLCNSADRYCGNRRNSDRP
ncbi:hypothetical protein V1523DRAFT_418368 [Lipomyces doorenjongii]